MNRKIGLYLACVGIFSVSLCLSAAAQNGTSVAFLKNNSEVFTVSDGEFNAEITFASPVPSETHSVLISYDGARITDISYEFLPSGAETFTTKKVSVSKDSAAPSVALMLWDKELSPVCGKQMLSDKSREAALKSLTAVVGKNTYSAAINSFDKTAVFYIPTDTNGSATADAPVTESDEAIENAKSAFMPSGNIAGTVPSSVNLNETENRLSVTSDDKSVTNDYTISFVKTKIARFQTFDDNTAYHKTDGSQPTRDFMPSYVGAYGNGTLSYWFDAGKTSVYSALQKINGETYLSLKKIFADGVTSGSASVSVDMGNAVPTGGNFVCISDFDFMALNSIVPEARDDGFERTVSGESLKKDPEFYIGNIGTLNQPRLYIGRGGENTICLRSNFNGGNKSEPYIFLSYDKKYNIKLVTENRENGDGTYSQYSKLFVDNTYVATFGGSDGISAASARYLSFSWFNSANAPLFIHSINTQFYTLD